MSSIHTSPENRSGDYRAGKNRQPEHTAACCGSRFGGSSTTHCSGCHRTFTGLTAFDLHRDGSHIRGARYCRDPYVVGLVDANRAYSCWGFPNDGAWTGPASD